MLAGACLTRSFAAGAALGLAMGMIESVWPRACYMMRLIDEHNPPTPLSGPSRPAGENPYSDFDMSQRWIAHCLVAIRSVSLVTLIPFSDTLFYRLATFPSTPRLKQCRNPPPAPTRSRVFHPKFHAPPPTMSFVSCCAGCTCTSGSVLS